MVIVANRHMLRVLAALSFAVVSGSTALANDGERGGEGSFEPKVYGASVDYDPNAPQPAPMPPGAFKF